MTARPILLAGAIVSAAGTLVLAGWLFDFSTATSIMSGWRVMVPATAASLVLAGLAIMTAAGHSRHVPNLLLSRGIAIVGLTLPLVTVIEYLTGARTGIEGWFGVSFDSASSVAGRMSPMTSLCLVVLNTSLIAGTLPGERATMIARIAAGSTLLTAWLAMLALAFDTQRFANEPRFPGMALSTIGLIALASWAALAISFERDPDDAAQRSPSPRVGALLFAAFAVPLLIGLSRGALAPFVAPQLMTSVLALLLSVTLATIVWNYSARMKVLRQERERAFVELEQRVRERTHELASRNAELRLSEDRLREDDRRKDEFLATLAHELRNPLAPIRSAVAVLRSLSVSDDDRLEAQLIIERQVAQLARLIDDLLDVSRITAGKLPLKKRQRQLSEIVNLAVATVRPHLDAQQHRLTVSLPVEPIVIDADEARLSQVFANLLHNACKYTEHRGDITLAASLAGDMVEIVVRDNGIGIPPEFLPRLFQKFSQVAPALERSQGGLGLGLALVHGIVTSHNGRVEARSDGVGRGSEFIVRLPVVAVKAAAVEASRPAVDDTPRSLVSRRVLVVDDNVDSADSLALLLRLNGHLVETAHDGAEALDSAERFQPDAILLDLGMPGLNGYEVCERIRMRPWAKGVLVIAQTGWGQAQDRARTHEAGFDAHLTKPIDPEVVQDMLVRLNTGTLRNA